MNIQQLIYTLYYFAIINISTMLQHMFYNYCLISSVLELLKYIYQGVEFLGHIVYTYCTSDSAQRDTMEHF